MIIAVSGAPIYDKTDVVSRLAAAHHVQIVRDPAPGLCTSYGFQTLYEMPAQLQRACREQLLSDHLASLQQPAEVIFEYSAAEWMADWMRWFWSATVTEDWERLLSMAAEAVRRYDAIYHLDTGELRTYDGYVWLDRSNSRQVSSLIRHLYAEFGVADEVRRG